MAAAVPGPAVLRSAVPVTFTCLLATPHPRGSGPPRASSAAPASSGRSPAASARRDGRCQPARPQPEISGTPAVGDGCRQAQGNAAGSCSAGQAAAAGAGTLLPAPAPPFPGSFWSRGEDPAGRDVGTERGAFFLQWQMYCKGAPVDPAAHVSTNGSPSFPKMPELFNIPVPQLPFPTSVWEVSPQSFLLQMAPLDPAPKSHPAFL